MKEFKFDLSIALIVKNEETTLERCLQSLMPLKNKLKTQIIITDTGSTDKTKDIAKRYADTLLDFNWCDDFSKARNTGAKKAEGRWFMFVDADEHFADGIDEIVEFLKSDNSKKYNQASIILKDYKYNKSDFIEYRLTRLFNFEETKREFIGLIHEGIGITGEVFPLEIRLSHDGYFQKKSNEKILRNEKLLNKAINENPSDLRNYLQIINATENDMQKLIEIDRMIKAARDNNLLDNDYYKIAIYEKLNLLNKLENFHAAISFADENIKNVSNNTLIYQEITLVYFKSLQMMGFYEKANEYIKKYQKCCEYIKKNSDNYFSLLQNFKTNHDKEYHSSFISLSENLLKLNKKKESISCLSNEIALYNQNNSYPLLEKYIIHACNLSEFSLIKKLYEASVNEKQIRLLIISVLEKILSSSKHSQLYEDLINELAYSFDGYTAILNLKKSDFINFNQKELELILNDDLLYTSEYFKDALYFDIKNNSNHFDFIKKCSATMLEKNFDKLSFEKSDYATTVYAYLKSSEVTDDIKDLFYYKSLIYSALITKDNDLNKKEICEMFEWFLSVSNLYNLTIYNENLNIEQIKYINKQDAVSYVLHTAYSNKEFDLPPYISALKLALSLDENLADV